MRQEYDRIYRELYTDYVSRFTRRYRSIFPNANEEFRLLVATNEAIDQIDQEKSLRSDAKYFLLVNFHHLIIEPLLEGKNEGIGQELSITRDLETAIRRDITDIVQEADGEQLDLQLVTGHQIMRAIDRIWERLQTTRFETWG